LKFLSKNYVYNNYYSNYNENEIYFENYVSLIYFIYYFNENKKIWKNKYESNKNFKKYRRIFLNKKELSIMYLNVLFRKGKKLRYLVKYNKCIDMFYESFRYKNNFFNEKFKDYDIVYEYLYKNKDIDIDYIFEHLLELNYMIFNVFLFKQQKNKKKKNIKFLKLFKYSLPEKRSSSFIKDLYNYSNKFNYYNIEDRILSSFLTVLYSQKESVLYKKKIYTYSKYIKKIVNFY